MALKDDLEGIKKEIGSQEQFLENIIKSELFIKKYKKPILTICVLATIGFISYFGYDFFNKKNIASANQSYSALITDPKNEEAKNNLKSKNINLYALYEFRNALDNNDTAKLEELSYMQNIDPLLKDIINYEANGNGNEILSSYSFLIKGYELLKADKIDAANAEFSKIPLNSPLSKIAKNLRHYNGNKK